jgi:hypothetical protein
MNTLSQVFLNKFNGGGPVSGDDANILGPDTIQLGFSSFQSSYGMKFTLNNTWTKVNFDIFGNTAAEAGYQGPPFVVIHLTYPYSPIVVTDPNFDHFYFHASSNNPGDGYICEVPHKYFDVDSLKEFRIDPDISSFKISYPVHGQDNEIVDHWKII